MRMGNEPGINVCIPFDPEANLGREYNRLMEQSRREWVLFLDHDVLMLNPHWHHLCQEAIRKYPEAGIFTAFTGNHGSGVQRLKWSPEVRVSVLEHKRAALQLWRKKAYSVTDISEHPISGFFLLTSKGAWTKAGGFSRDGLFGVDRNYQRRVTGAGLRVYRIDGIYALHIRDRIEGSWIDGLKTSKELWAEYNDRQRVAQ
jgi:GT2 family glycosyltransferase